MAETKFSNYSAGQSGMTLKMATILIVEDEVFIRQTAEFTIEDLGHEILVAGDVDQALSHLSTSQSIDALFVDMRLAASGLGGCEVANHAVVQRPELRVLYTSGKPFSEAMKALFVTGGQFLQKPYSPAQLELSVGTLLQ
jgi:DNA-binding NtrC family response regulator